MKSNCESSVYTVNEGRCNSNNSFPLAVREYIADIAARDLDSEKEDNGEETYPISSFSYPIVSTISLPQSLTVTPRGSEMDITEYPDKVLLRALNELAAKKPKWLPSSLRTVFKKRNILGDVTMVFSLERYGIPLFSSVYVPWVMVWEVLISRFKDCTPVEVNKGDGKNGYENKAFCSDLQTTATRSFESKFTLRDLDDILEAMSYDEGRSRRPMIYVNCGPCMKYMLQFIICHGGLSVLLQLRDFNMQSKSQLAWVIAEVAMLAHYSAARLNMQAEKLIVTVYDCWLPRRGRLGRKSIGVSEFIRQPRLCISRVANSAKNCRPEDITVSGYMKVSQSVYNINGVLACSDGTIKRALSFGL